MRVNTDYITPVQDTYDPARRPGLEYLHLEYLQSVLIASARARVAH